MTGATITPVGMPAWASLRNALRRAPGALARGSRVLAMLPSSEPTDIYTRTRFLLAMYASMSISCVMEADLVVMATGRSEEHTSELQSLMRNSYAVFCLK